MAKKIEVELTIRVKLLNAVEIDPWKWSTKDVSRCLNAGLIEVIDSEVVGVFTDG